MAISWGSVFRVSLLLVLVAGIATACFTLPVEKILKDFLVWIDKNLGPWGPLVLALVYIPLTVLAVPASILTIGGGYLFGLPIGFIADSIGSTMGCTAAFIVGKTIGRSYVASKLNDYPQFQAVSIATQRSGFKLLRRALNANSVVEAQSLVDYAKCIVDFSFHALREAMFELGFGKSSNEKMLYVVEEKKYVRLVKHRISSQKYDGAHTGDRRLKMDEGCGWPFIAGPCIAATCIADESGRQTHVGFSDFDVDSCLPSMNSSPSFSREDLQSAIDYCKQSNTVVDTHRGI